MRKLVIFKPYTSIKDFLHRFTLLKVGKLHIRLHKITDSDQSTLYHNHPFHYISIILKAGYRETQLIGNKKIEKVHKPFSIIVRNRNVFHRIDELFGKTVITLFIAYGNYGWKAINTAEVHDDGLYERVIKGKKVWSKKEKGIWFIGSEDHSIAAAETRHSIHQIL